MGVIQRQSIKNSIVNYLAVGIGAISTILVYPLIPQEDLGMIKFVADTAAVFIPFAQFGLGQATILFFPQFRDEKNGHRGFLFLMLAPITIFALLVCGAIYVFQDPIGSFFGADNKIKFLKLLPFVLCVLFFATFSNWLVYYISNFNRIVIPSILSNLLTKVSQPLLVLAFYWGLISLKGVWVGTVLTFAIMLVSLVLYTVFLRQWHWKPRFEFYTSEVLRNIWNYASFTTLVVFSGAVATHIHVLIVPAVAGFAQSAVYSVGALIAEAIDVPRKALSGIAAPLVTTSLQSGNMAHVEEVYRRSALVQTVAGVLLLGGAWLCADSLFDLMPKHQEAFRAGKNVIFWLGLARVIDMMTGINAEIITYSSHYRFNMISLMTMAITNILTALWLMPTLGIEGAAIATLVAMFLVNIWRLLFIYNKMKIQPLSWKMLLVWAIGVVSFWVADGVKGDFFPIFEILLRGGIFALIFIGSILYFKIIPDINEMVKKIFKK